MNDIIPENLASLHSAEEQLRQKARSMIADDPRLQLHLAMTETARHECRTPCAQSGLSGDDDAWVPLQLPRLGR